MEQPEKVLKEILSQTAGQPYLTQFLCAKVQKEGEKNRILTIYAENTSQIL